MKQWICIICDEDTANQFCLKWKVRWLKGKVQVDGCNDECYFFPLPEWPEEFEKYLEEGE
jgi:hypothetical protein